VPGAKQPFLSKFDDPKTRDWAYFQSADAIRRLPELLGYAHHILRAFEKDVLGITGVLCIDSRPTIYFRRDKKPLSWTEANRLHRIFWNQGIATVLILADPERLRIYSSQARPVDLNSADENPPALIGAQLENIADLLELEQLLHEVASGQFYHEHAGQFDEKLAVDECLLKNLADTRDRLITGEHRFKNEETAHALLGRLIFLCYLTDRGVINWSDYENEVGKDIKDVRQLLTDYDYKEGKQRLYRLFKRLQDTFNGSMFDQNLETEARRLKPVHYEVLREFFSVTDVATGQGTLGFWAYDFSVIPVETISAVYEDFLSKEDAEGKRKKGAYYTPRHLAEMVVDIAIADDPDWARRRYLDCSCGSGIFLVTLFNRLASHWVFQHDKATYRQQADALLKILHEQLCGVDIERTACRIACFSLYLAFLDQFDPRDIHEFALKAGRGRKVLPKLLRYRKSRWREDFNPTILEGDFLQSDTTTDKFDYLIGNPPWSDRGTKQEAWRFMQHAPEHLLDRGCGCLLLPAKVFFNKTDELQAEWFDAVTVERIVNLSDFRHILFEHAKCPALIVRFSNTQPAVDHRIQYDTPKVSGTDCRDGVITILPRDRKRLQQTALLAVARRKQTPRFWKQYFSGTPRDWRLLDLLDEMPKLDAIAKPFSKDKENKARFWTSEGIKPNKNGTHKPWWDDEHLYLSARLQTTALFVLEKDCEAVGKRFHPVVERRRDPKLFVPPLIVVSYGFGKIAFCDFPVLFQHSLRVITSSAANPSAREADSDLMFFLTAYLRSSLAKYYLFHISANWGIERDKVHLFELIQLPFPLPGDSFAHADAADIVAKTAAAAKSLRDELAVELNQLHKEREKKNLLVDSKQFQEMLAAFSEKRRKKVDSLQARLERDIYRYFDLTDEEIALVDDTVKYIEPSSTPPNRETVRNAEVPTLKTVSEKDEVLLKYANTLTATLNEWADGGRTRVEASAARLDHNPFVLFHLRQTNRPRAFRFEKFNNQIEAVLERIYEASREKQGRFNYPRAVTFFDDDHISIYLLKPNTLSHWTRSAALNDADEIFAEVIRQRRANTR